MNIYLHELKIKIKSILIWSLSIAVLILVFMSLFEGFSKDSALVSSLMSKFPPELMAAFGMQDMDFSSLLGFFALLFVFSQICLAIQAANYGFGLVSVEETDWTADFLLSKPVKRTSIMTAKLLAALTALLITELVITGASFLFLNAFRGGQEIPVKALVMLLLSMPVFQLFFLSVGMVISLMVKRLRSVIPFSMALVFGLYILNAFGGMVGEKSLEVISPFQHFAPSYIVKNAGWDMSLVPISIGVIVVCIAASYILYARRNVASPV